MKAKQHTFAYQQIMEKIKKEIKICIETNENATTPNLWDSVKAVLRGRFIAIQVYLKTQDKHQINNITLHLRHLEKEEENTQVIRRKEIMKIRAEINEKETKENIAKINKTKSCSFEKINKIDKPLARLPCFPGNSDGKASACNAGDPGSIPGSRKIPWRREWLPTPVFLPGEFHG